MAAVGTMMDEPASSSYAERAKRATAQVNSRSNAKLQSKQIAQDAVDAPSASTPDLLDSSSSAHTTATNLALPSSAPMSSASSRQASPTRPAQPLPPRNAWSERSPWRTPQKTQQTANHASSVTESPKMQTLVTPTTLQASKDGRGTLTNSSKAPNRTAQLDDSDPFVVNYNINPPSLADAQNWPQVGITTSPVASPHRSKPSLSSVSSNTVTFTPQTPATASQENENDATPSKKAKGEKTKWVPIPPKELLAAADEATKRSQHGGSSSKSHSPRVNGRTYRQGDEGPEALHTNQHSIRGEKSPIIAGNTRHDRNSSLTVPSSTSSQRVSPLNLTTSLPSPASHTLSEQNLAPSFSQSSQAPSPSNHAHAAYRTQPNPTQSSMGQSFAPQGLPAHSRAHSRTSSQSVYVPPPVVGYAPVWPVPAYGPPYYAAHPPYPHVAHSYLAHPVPSAVIQSVATQTPHLPRERRRRRPSPQEAALVAGYRENVSQILTVDATISPSFFMGLDEETLLDVQSSPRDSTNHAGTRARDAWWSHGVEEAAISRWLRRQVDLLPPRMSGQALSEKTRMTFGSPAAPLSNGEDFPVEQSSSQAGDVKPHQLDPRNSAVFSPSWIPGSGPTPMDVGMAMRAPMVPPSMVPPPLLMGMPTPSSAGPSPVSATNRADWPHHDDAFSAQPPSYPYSAYAYPQAQAANASYGSDGGASPRSPYNNEGLARGGHRWRDDRYPRGGRGRGIPGRGRGFRGSGWPRPQQSPSMATGGHNQLPYPPQLPHNPATIYIPEPFMHAPMYPYAPPFLAPLSSNPVAQSAETSNEAQGRPPSPKPLTPINFPLDLVRYKLLGQIEYYFSRDNVAKDIYLRERMDSRGWVPLVVLQSFPRVQRLGVNDDMIRDTLALSHFVEVLNNHVRMAREDWKNFVLPNAAESAVPEPPAWFPNPPPGYAPGYMYPPPPPHFYPYYAPPQRSSPLSHNDIAEHILRRPEEKLTNGNGALESGTSAGDFNSTPHTDGEDVETSEDDVVFLISEPLPMQRSAAGSSTRLTP